mmetsp:Transcript_17449/g.31841  ORF Transcript_17449/g.31841 Transcript_17449/m.31841 type:complete len:369 (-) Transcript_17449:320-1426(-)
MSAAGTKLVLTGNSKLLTMLFSSLGAGGVITVGGLAATGNLYNALKLLLEGAENGSSGERVTRRLTQHADTTADQILAKLSQQQAPVTIVNGGSRNGKDLGTILVLVGVGGGAIFYACKTQLVSKKHVAQHLGVVGQKLASLQNNVAAVREKMQVCEWFGDDGAGLSFHSLLQIEHTTRLMITVELSLIAQIAYNGLRKRLDHSIEMQDDLKNEVQNAQQSIEDVKDDTEKIAGAIEGCQQELIEASRKQEFTARGVQLLCGVVAESMPTGRSKKELESFLKGNPGMLPPSSTGLRRSRSDGSRRSERKALMAGGGGERTEDGQGAGSDATRTPRRLFVDQRHRDQYGSNQDENSEAEDHLARSVRHD